ncbi:serine/arginine repetitive matrix protein 1-like [Clytia hemisphaerica]|uniref:Uncharacterized protein n=1 Tax=Clytia hemisphaerica TaxID=252671 RepID=A0A7M6DMN5_9CNID
MTAGCEFCQHPSCWEYDVNQPRKGVSSPSLPNKLTKNQSKNDQPNRPKDTGLPTYKIINFTIGDVLEDELDYYTDSSCSDHEEYKTHRKSPNSRLSSPRSFPVGPSVSFDKGCLERIRKRQKEVEDQEKHKLNDHATLNSHTKVLTKQMVVLDKPLQDVQKMLVWVPGKNDQKDKHTVTSEKKKTVSEYVIDGASLPQDDENKKSSKDRVNKEPPGVRAFRKLNHGYLDELLPMMIEQGITLDDYLTLCRISNMQCDDVIDNRGDIVIPSALKTSRIIPLPKTPIVITREPHICNLPLSSQISTRPQQLSKSVMYIKNGDVVAAPIRQKKRRRRTKKELLHRWQPNPRDALDMSRAAIPKRALKKYSIVDHHCKESIRMDRLASDILIQPLSGSEASSICSMTLAEKKEEENDLIRELKGKLNKMSPHPSVHMPHAPTCSPTPHRRNSIPVELSRMSRQDSIIQQRLSRSSQSATRRMSKETSTVHFQESAVMHSYDSRRVSTAPSLFSELVDLRKSLDEGDQNKPSIVKSESRAFSVLSEQSSHFSGINRDLIDDAYSKYNSFTPFKTPLQSKHQINRTGTEQSQRASLDVPHPVQRLVVSPSLHAMGEILETTSRQKNSFTTTHRSISPTRNFSRHQKAASTFDMTPAEIKISKVQLQPARCKSPMRTKIESNHEPIYSSLPHYDAHESSPRIEPMPSRESQHVPPPSPVFKTSKTSNTSTIPTFLLPSPNNSVHSSGTQQEVAIQFYNQTDRSNDQIQDSKPSGDVGVAGKQASEAENIQPSGVTNIAEEPSIRSPIHLDSQEDSTEHQNGKENNVENEIDSNEGMFSLESVNEEDIKILVSATSESEQQQMETEEIQGVESQPINDLEDVSPILNENNEDFDQEEVQNHIDSDKDLLRIHPTDSLDTRVVSTTGCLTPSECQIKIPDINKLSENTMRGLTSPIKNEDLIDGLSLDLNLNEDILKALGNIDDFVLDSSDEDDDGE